MIERTWPEKTSKIVELELLKTRCSGSLDDARDREPQSVVGFRGLLSFRETDHRPVAQGAEMYRSTTILP